MGIAEGAAVGNLVQPKCIHGNSYSLNLAQPKHSKVVCRPYCRRDEQIQIGCQISCPCVTHVRLEQLYTSWQQQEVLVARDENTRFVHLGLKMSSAFHGRDGAEWWTYLCNHVSQLVIHQVDSRHFFTFSPATPDTIARHFRLTVTDEIFTFFICVMVHHTPSLQCCNITVLECTRI